MPAAVKAKRDPKARVRQRAASKRGGKGDVPFVPPQLATLVDAAPEGDDWIHEVKYDGFRILCRVQQGVPTLFTRTEQDWTGRFPELAAAARKLSVRSALIDGEAAVLRPDGTTSFQALQNYLGESAGGKLSYFAFDLLFLDGEDLRALPLEERKRKLERVLSKRQSDVIKFSDHVVGNGSAFFDKAAEAGLEGIISKRRKEPYHSGRSPWWQKTKALKRQEFVVGGFTEPEGARSGIGALLVGTFRGRDLIYSGKVGTGFGRTVAIDLRDKLDLLVTKVPPFKEMVRGAGRLIHWVKPLLVAEVAFSELTADGKLRHPSFQGLREDKPARDVVAERPRHMAEVPRKPPSQASRRKKQVAAPATAASRAAAGAGTNITKMNARTSTKTTASAGARDAVAGVRLTHPERLLEKTGNVTKKDLAEYLHAVAPHMLPHVAGRPLSLVRCPEGTAGKCFFMKHAAFSTPEFRRVSIQEKEGKGDYLIADTEAALVSLAQMSVLEVHTWNSVDGALETPDRVVFDFDPGPKAAWKDVVRGALLVKDGVEGLGGKAFLKSTGGKGLHVVVPLQPAAGWDECRTFSQIVSESVVASDPKRFTTNIRKAGREDKVLLDYFRNNRGSTSVAAFSTRARPGMPLSMPLDWDEIQTFDPKRPFTIASGLRRLEAGRPDPWAAYDASRVRLHDLISDSKANRATHSLH